MLFKIPLFDLNYDEQEENAIIETLRSKWISTGPKCKKLEKMFSDMLGCKYALTLTNCTSSLHLAIRILEIGEGDEIITPSLTFVAAVNAIRYINANPVFAEIKSFGDLTIDPDDIERKITEKTRAIIVMHYGGFTCDMDRIMEIAKKYKLKVIEDACHGPLSEHKGKKLGTIGDIGCFSFFSNKNISTGEGGMLVTDSSEYFEKARLLRSHGMTSLSYERAKGHSTGYDVIELGYNHRMDDIRASIGIVQLNKLEKDLKKRVKVRKLYEEYLSNIDEITIPFKNYREFSSNYIFPIILKNSDFNQRNKIREKLAEAGIQTSIHYLAVHRFSIYKDFYTDLPKTDYVSNNLITLPMYSKMEQGDIKYIAKNLSDLLR